MRAEGPNIEQGTKCRKLLRHSGMGQAAVLVGRGSCAVGERIRHRSGPDPCHSQGVRVISTMGRLVPFHHFTIGATT